MWKKLVSKKEEGQITLAVEYPNVYFTETGLY